MGLVDLVDMTAYIWSKKSADLGKQFDIVAQVNKTKKKVVHKNVSQGFKMLSF